MSYSTVEDTVAGWIQHFASADRQMTWLASEEELSMPLVPGVVLAGRVDGRGDDWFAEFKSMSKYGRSGWREKWRFHPQSLTYGLLLREAHPEINRFTIRVAIKSDPPTFDHEWFSYSQGEIDTWRFELIKIADRIRFQMSNVPVHREHWDLNPLSCYKFGTKYPCPFIHSCTHQEWDVPVAGLVRRVPHLKLEQDAWANEDNTLVLDATRITEYLECPESFRRQYIRQEVEPLSEALQFGLSFHSYLNAYYERLVAGVYEPWPYAPKQIGDEQNGGTVV